MVILNLYNFFIIYKYNSKKINYELICNNEQRNNFNLKILVLSLFIFNILSFRNIYL